MKNIFKFGCSLVLAFILMAVSVDGNAQQKLGYLNSAAILSEMGEWKAAEQEVGTLRTQLENDYKNQLESYQTEINTLQQKVQTGSITQAQLDQEQQRLLQKEQSIAQFEIEASQKVLQKEQELLTPILEKAQNVIKQVAEENGYTYVFDVSANGGIVYALPADDITELVKPRL